MGDIAKLATQLTPVESLRAVVLLEEALKQLAFLGKLAKEPKSVKGNQIVGAAGDEIIRIIGEQQELGEMYAVSHPQTAAARRQEVDEKLNNVSAKLKEANRDLCRNLRQTPNIQAKRRNREMMQAVRLLEAELKKEAAEYAENRRVSSVEILNLKEELQKLRTKAAIKLAFQEKALMAQHDGMQWLHRQEEKQQEDELLELQREADMDSFIYNTSTEFHTNLIKQQLRNGKVLFVLCSFYAQLHSERERLHQLHQQVNAEKQKEMTLLLKRQNSLSRALGIAQSRIEEEDRIAREAAAAEQRDAWICMQRQQQEEQTTTAATASAAASNSSGNSNSALMHASAVVAAPMSLPSASSPPTDSERSSPGSIATSTASASTASVAAAAAAAASAGVVEVRMLAASDSKEIISDCREKRDDCLGEVKNTEAMGAPPVSATVGRGPPGFSDLWESWKDAACCLHSLSKVACYPSAAAVLGPALGVDLQEAKSAASCLMLSPHFAAAGKTEYPNAKAVLSYRAFKKAKTLCPTFSRCFTASVFCEFLRDAHGDVSTQTAARNLLNSIFNVHLKEKVQPYLNDKDEFTMEVRPLSLLLQLLLLLLQQVLLLLLSLQQLLLLLQQSLALMFVGWAEDSAFPALFALKDEDQAAHPGILEFFARFLVRDAQDHAAVVPAAVAAALAASAAAVAAAAVVDGLSPVAAICSFACIAAAAAACFGAAAVSPFISAHAAVLPLPNVADAAVAVVAAAAALALTAAAAACAFVVVVAAAVAAAAAVRLFFMLDPGRRGFVSPLRQQQQQQQQQQQDRQRQQ
ncbi:hypothetical protein Emag_003050 [Eimeria magna]